MLNEKTKKLAEENIDLVKRVVNEKFKDDIICNPGLYDDYVGVGNLGLVLACQRYNETLGYSFSTYAYHAIWGEIRRFKRDKQNIIKLPRSLYEAGTQYYMGTKKNKDIDTICAETKVSKKDIEEWLNKKDVIYLDKKLKDSNNNISESTQLDMLSDNYNLEDNVVDKITYDEKKAILEKILTDKEIQIINLIELGITKQKELAKHVGYSQVYIGKILKKLTEVVGPTVEEYYSGKISWETLCKKVKVKNKKKSAA